MGLIAHLNSDLFQEKETFLIVFLVSLQNQQLYAGISCATLKLFKED